MRTSHPDCHSSTPVSRHAQPMHPSFHRRPRNSTGSANTHLDECQLAGYHRRFRITLTPGTFCVVSLPLPFVKTIWQFVVNGVANRAADHVIVDDTASLQRGIHVDRADELEAATA